MQTITLVQKNEVKGDGDGMEKNKEAARSKWGSICIGIGDALGDYFIAGKIQIQIQHRRSTATKVCIGSKCSIKIELKLCRENTWFHDLLAKIKAHQSLLQRNSTCK